MRILQLIPRFVFPADDGGKIGIANIYMEFAKQDCQVTLFSFNDEKISETAMTEAKKYGKVLLFEHSTKNTSLRIAGSVFSRNPLFITKHEPEQAKAYLAELLKKENFDVIHCDHSSMAPLGFHARSLCGAPVGLRQHNIEWTIWARYAESLPLYNPTRFYIQRQAKLLKAAEKRIFSLADINFSITQPDLLRAQELAPDGKYAVATAGVNPEEWLPCDKIQRERKTLILATTYRWVHNVDAVRWFVSKVLPLVKNSIPDIKLQLIGKGAPEWLAEIDGVELIGYVDKVQPYLNKAGVYVAPLFVGGGIRIKILEAMAMMLPVVATGIAAEGITAGESDGLFIAESPQAFAEKIIALVNNADLASYSGGAARKFILQNHLWSDSVRIMLNEYNKIIS